MHLHRFLLAVCPIFITALMACQEPAPSPTPANPNPGGDSAVANALRAKAATPDSTALEGEWYLQPALPSDTATGKAAILRFDLKKSRFTGNTGCNNMSGKFWYSAQDSSLSFSDKLITTKMACTGYNERGFIKSMLLTTHFRIADGVLTLLAQDNAELSHWARKPASGVKPLKA